MFDTPRRQSGAWSVLLCAACITLLAAGCFSAPTKSPLMEQAEGKLIDLTSVQLREQLYDFTSRFATVVQESADEITRTTDDPAVREAALLWKLRAIPEVHRAAFRPDPLAGLFDTAVLCGQMEQFFRKGAGAGMFGEQQQIAIDASAKLNRDVWSLAESLSGSGDPELARRNVAEFVAGHPIDDLYFLRDSVDSLLASMTKGRRGGAGAAIGGINEAVDDLSRRLTIYAAYLPNAARWQAELAVMQMARYPPVKDSLLALESLAESHRLLGESAAAVPDLITAERKAAFEEMESLSQRRIADVDQQRVDSIAALKSEREVLVRVIEAQTDLALQRIQEERVATMTQLQQIADATVGSSFDRADRLADRLFFRGLVLVAILALVLLVAGVLIARMFRPRPAL